MLSQPKVDDINLISLELDQNVINAKLMHIKKSLACIASYYAVSDKDDEKECDKIICPSCKIALKNEGQIGMSNHCH